MVFLQDIDSAGQSEREIPSEVSSDWISLLRAWKKIAHDP